MCRSASAAKISGGRSKAVMRSQFRAGEFGAHPRRAKSQYGPAGLQSASSCNDVSPTRKQLTRIFPVLSRYLHARITADADWGESLKPGLHTRCIWQLGCPGSGRHVLPHSLPWHNHPRLVHGIKSQIHVGQHMLDRFDQLQPDLRPEPIALRAGVSVAHVDGHFEVHGAFPNLPGRQRPEGVEVMVDLVPELVDYDGILLSSEFEPDIEPWRWVPASSLSVYGGCVFDGARLFCQQRVELLLGSIDYVVDRVCSGFRGRALRGRGVD